MGQRSRNRRAHAGGGGGDPGNDSIAIAASSCMHFLWVYIKQCCNIHHNLILRFMDVHQFIATCHMQLF